MSKPAFRNWQSVQEEVRRRIYAREWKPGELIPNEVDLAEEFGCARTTVNRALRGLADSGLLDRRRKAGTRVRMQPVARATLNIPVIRQEVEDKGLRYGYQRMDRRMERPPLEIAAALDCPPAQEQLHVRALHFADARPYALEDRWINLTVAPDAASQSFESLSSNEWLLRHAPYTHGDIRFSAADASPAQAACMGCAPGAALFVIDRVTWDNDLAITKVTLSFAPGYELRSSV